MSKIKSIGIFSNKTKKPIQQEISHKPKLPYFDYQRPGQSVLNLLEMKSVPAQSISNHARTPELKVPHHEGFGPGQKVLDLLENINHKEK